MGINLGAFIATLLCAYLGETFGWKFGFGAAGLGMLIGLLTFKVGAKTISDQGNPPDPSFLEKNYILLK